MTYDPISMKWNGNEGELEEFERKIAQVASKPKLIDQKSTQIPTKVGEMVFDPVALVWRGNEDKDDAHIFDDIDTFAGAVKPKNEFGMDKGLMELIRKSEIAHKLFIGNWYAPALGKSRIVRDTSKSYLYDIRSVQI